MQAGTLRETVDLSGYPDLVMVLLGFKVRRWRALPALFGIGRGLAAMRTAKPDGLLGDEQFMFGWNHLGIRQYWRDAESLGRFTRDTPHAGWWRDFLRDTQGCGFWHEAYHARGGIEAIYVGMPERPGLGGFAPIRQPVGPFMSSQGRMKADAVARSR
ncbi:monooxygenase family protein [Sphingomonas mollis]|uniref:DUF4188 domain-containing protein n=1 Tax=Sphingomonas mollis TaxID=2795726 RepID=A0ABS0XSL4_9SPHN|nr:DUF4188 domain-containing protein [Sphingomonas sp. BT553]MBJ6122733.1 DUF4188 domain-containing protein [Sphingomonas sp. BT553]